jgi:hypothetical protein
MIEIIDDHLEKSIQNKIEDLLLKNDNMPYFYQDDTVDPCDDAYKNREIIRQPQYSHAFYKDEKINSPFYGTIIQYFKVNLKPYKIKSNILHINNKRGFHYPHIDHPNGISMIYYVNETDGDTHFFNENLKVIKKISPKKGRLLIFDSNILHSSSPPRKHDTRCVINFVFSK